MSDFLFDRLTSGLQSVLDLRMKQHTLTSSNIANANTPNYRAKVIDFSHVLQEAVDGSKPLQASDAMHMQPKGYDASRPSVDEIEPSPYALDGNSVLPERETARMTANSIMYGAVAKGMSRKLALLKFAAADGK